MSAKITFQELVDRVAAATGISKHLAHDLIKEYAAVVEEGLVRDGKVRIAQFGTFRLHRVPETTGINPQTAASLVIPEHTRVLFRPAQALARRVNREYAHLKAEPSSNKAEEPTRPSITPEPLDLGEPPPEKPKKPTRRLPINTIAIAGAAAIVIVIIVLIIFRGQEREEAAPPPVAEEPSVEAVQPTPAEEASPEEPAPPSIADEPIEEPTPPPKPMPTASPAETPPPPSSWAQGMKVHVHTVKRNDNWWNLAGIYYQNVLYWPNIYLSNASKLNNPDLLFVGIEVLIPAIEGLQQQLTAMDSLDLATGYYEAYRAYESLGKDDAIDYLRAFRRYK